LLLAVLLVPAVAADWTATGTVLYRDREFDPTGFTGIEPLPPVRYADVEVLDANGGATLGQGATDAGGGFSIAIVDTEIRDVYVRVLARSDQTTDLDLRVRDVSGNVYAIAGPTAFGHAPDVDQHLGLMIAEPTQGGEAFNLFDVGVLGMDYIVFLEGSRPTQSLAVKWQVDGGYNGASATPTLITLRDTGGYDDSVLLHEFGHWAVFEYSVWDSPGGYHALANCDQNPRLAWDEGHASYFGSAVRRHFGLPNAHIYVRTTGESGPGHVALYFEMEDEIAFECSGDTSEVSVYTALWDITDGPDDNDSTVGTDDVPGDTLDLPDIEVWEVVRDGLPTSSDITTEDFWDKWFETPISNGFHPEMESIFFGEVEIEFREDAHEPNDLLEDSAPVPVDGAPVHATFFQDPDGDGSGADVDDEDWFSFQAYQDASYRIETLNLLDAADTFLRLHNSGGSQLASNDDRETGDPSSLIDWTAPSDGVYHVRVHAYHNQPDTHYGSYDISIAAPPDSDGDGVPDPSDVCVDIPDPGQEDADADGAGDACDPCPGDPDDDLDADGLCGDLDNCPDDANPGQEDLDLDGLGDVCDTDVDGDGVDDGIDNCLTVPNDLQTNDDADTLGNACDNCPVNDNLDQLDADDDGVGDVCDDDRDGDGHDNGADCAPDLRVTFDLPGELVGLRFGATTTTLLWNGSENAHVFNLQRGTVPAGQASPTLTPAGNRAWSKGRSKTTTRPSSVSSSITWSREPTAAVPEPWGTRPPGKGPMTWLA